MHVCRCGPGEVVAAHYQVHDYACCHLQDNCLESGISFVPQYSTYKYGTYLLSMKCLTRWSLTVNHRSVCLHREILLWPWPLTSKCTISSNGTLAVNLAGEIPTCKQFVRYWRRSNKLYHACMHGETENIEPSVAKCQQRH